MSMAYKMRWRKLSCEVLVGGWEEEKVDWPNFEMQCSLNPEVQCQ